MSDSHWKIWCFTRSLVNHWVPPGLRSNSTLGNGPNIGRRCPLRYVGDDPGNLNKIFEKISVTPVR